MPTQLPPPSLAACASNGSSGALAAKMDPSSELRRMLMPTTRPTKSPPPTTGRSSVQAPSRPAPSTSTASSRSLVDRALTPAAAAPDPKPLSATTLLAQLPTITSPTFGLAPSLANHVLATAHHYTSTTTHLAMRVAAMVRLLAAGRAALAPPGVPSVPGGPTESVTLVGSGPVALAIAKSLATNPPTGAKAVALTSRLPLTQPPAQSLPPSPRLAVTHTCDVAAAVQRAGTVVVCVPPAHTRHVAQVHVHPHDPGSVVLVVAAGLASLVVRRWFVAGSDAAPVASRVVHVALDPKEVEGGEVLTARVVRECFDALFSAVLGPCDEERPWNAAQVVPLIRKTMAHFGIQVLTSTPVNDYPSWVAFIGTIDFLAQLTRCVSSTNHE